MKRLISNTQTKEKIYIDLTEEEITQRQLGAELEIQRQSIEDIKHELRELDVEINRVQEDIVSQLNVTLDPSKQAIMDRKKELRQMLKEV
jgi:signal recognition particle subunit SEC65